MKFSLTIPSFVWTGYSPGNTSAIQSGNIKPIIELTSTISIQRRGIFLYPTLGLDIKINLLKVSDGFGNHLPDPCSEHVGPLATIVPAGNKRISINLNPPCSLFCNLSNSIIEACISFNALGG